jgi:hypothetical protein
MTCLLTYILTRKIHATDTVNHAKNKVRKSIPSLPESTYMISPVVITEIKIMKRDNLLNVLSNGPLFDNILCLNH